MCRCSLRAAAAGTFVEYHIEVCFEDVVTRWLDAPHPRWGEQYPDKVRSLLKNWVLAADITVAWPSRSTGTPIAKVPIGALTADHYNQAFELVRTARAHRIYTEVHGLVVQILRWAIANRCLRPHDQDTLAHLHLHLLAYAGPRISECLSRSATTTGSGSVTTAAGTSRSASRSTGPPDGPCRRRGASTAGLSWVTGSPMSLLHRR